MYTRRSMDRHHAATRNHGSGSGSAPSIGIGRRRTGRFSTEPSRIGEFWGHPETREFGELLIDLEEDRVAKAVIWGLLREMERK
jgi:hypothetical protein